MNGAQVAIIGGSGFYQMEGLTEVQEVKLYTPFGAPSTSIILGTLHGVRVAFLARHDIGHRLLPSELPFRANIWALKSLGVTRIISVSAVGSLREEIAPLHFVVPDQIIDRTRHRPSTFFGEGIVAHISFADPFCPDLSRYLYEVTEKLGITVHRGGTYICIEGPAFSTRAESALYRSWGASLIGMTAVPEAKLAREAEICYATLAAVTDYDVWREAGEEVSVDLVVTRLEQNIENAKRIIGQLVQQLEPERHCACANALYNAIITAPDAISAKAKQDLAPIIGKYVT